MSRRDNIGGKVFALHMASPGLIPDTIHGPLNINRGSLLSTETGIAPECCQNDSNYRNQVQM